MLATRMRAVSYIRVCEQGLFWADVRQLPILLHSALHAPLRWQGVKVVEIVKIVRRGHSQPLHPLPKPDLHQNGRIYFVALVQYNRTYCVALIQPQQTCQFLKKSQRGLNQDADHSPQFQIQTVPNSPQRSPQSHPLTRAGMTEDDVP
jgi:hypothetical protein